MEEMLDQAVGREAEGVKNCMSFRGTEERSRSASVSVVIPAYRSQHLKSVVAAARRVEADEVLIVTSSPKVPQVSGEEVEVVHVEDRSSPAEARNIGAERAQR